MQICLRPRTLRQSLPGNSSRPAWNALSVQLDTDFAMAKKAKTCGQAPVQASASQAGVNYRTGTLGLFERTAAVRKPQLTFQVTIETSLPDSPPVPSRTGTSIHSLGTNPFGLTWPSCARSPAIALGRRAGSTPVSCANFLRSSLRRSCSAFFAARKARFWSAAAFVAAASAVPWGGAGAVDAAEVVVGGVEDEAALVEACIFAAKEPRVAAERSKSSRRCARTALLMLSCRRRLDFRTRSANGGQRHEEQLSRTLGKL